MMMRGGDKPSWREGGGQRGRVGGRGSAGSLSRGMRGSKAEKKHKTASPHYYL